MNGFLSNISNKKQAINKYIIQSINQSINQSIKLYTLKVDSEYKSRISEKKDTVTSSVHIFVESTMRWVGYCGY